ncbi:hypothetical protein [Serratia rhizosphaerae]
MFDFIQSMIERTWFAYVILFIMAAFGVYYLYSFINDNCQRITMEGNQEEARRNGIQGKAVIISSNLTPELQDVLVKKKKSLDLTISVTGPDDISFEVRTTHLVNPLMLDDYRMGKSLVVKFVPGDKEKTVIIDNNKDK